MEFPHSFYEDEIRCDFLIPSMVKRTWAAQIQILADLDEAFSKCGMEYFAEWGSLLGTIRHGGFIPWDDDMDICMKRADYENLVRNYRDILPDNYSVVSFRSSRDYKQMMCRVVNSDHYRFDPEFMHKYSGLPFAMGIDIFPLDFLTGDEEYEKEREERADLVYGVVNEIVHFDTPVSSLKENLREIERVCNISIDPKGDVLTQLRELLEKIFGEVLEKDAEYITLYPLWMNRHRYRMPVWYYQKSIRLPFENTTIRVPVCYDAILKLKYGSSYMVHKRSGGAHEYPYFEDHVNVLKEHFGFEWPAYRFSEKDLPDTKVRNVSTAGSGKTCVFITYSAKAYENMRSLVCKYVKDGYEVLILPVPKFDIAADMTGITPSTETVDGSYYTAGTHGAKVIYDPHVLDLHPDVIVSNYPYDEYNLITTTDKTYYSKALRAHTDRLVYVPPFEARSIKEDDERSQKLMPLYVNTPLPVVCDEIVLHSTEQKERYIECLTAFSGEVYRKVWEDKITVMSGVPEDTKSPAGKKKIMFYVGITGFAECGHAMIEKIREVFEIFDENRDKADVIYTVQEGLKENLRELYPELYAEYEANDFRESVTVYDTDDIDAYYGEASAYATAFIDEHKPVMIMDWKERK